MYVEETGGVDDGACDVEQAGQEEDVNASVRGVFFSWNSRFDWFVFVGFEQGLEESNGGHADKNKKRLNAVIIKKIQWLIEGLVGVWKLCAGLVFSEDGVNATEEDGTETEVKKFGGEHGSLKGAFCYNEQVSIINSILL